MTTNGNYSHVIVCILKTFGNVCANVTKPQKLETSGFPNLVNYPIIFQMLKDEIIQNQSF